MPAESRFKTFFAAKQKEDFTMRDFSIDLVWAKIQMAITAVGGWLGYFARAV